MHNKITAIIGPQGSGKTHLAKQLSAAKKALWLDRHDLNYARLNKHITFFDGRPDIVIYDGATEADFDMLNYIWNTQELPHLIVTSQTLRREDFNPQVEVIELVKTKLKPNS